MPHIPQELAESKPLEVVSGTDHLLKADVDSAVEALQHLVEQSAPKAENGADPHDVRNGVHAPFHQLSNLPFVHKLVPGLEDLANEYHFGNYVVVRGTGVRIFESMPIYPRLGMHVLYYGKSQIKFLHTHSVEKVLKELSVHQGSNYDSPESVKSIPSFIETYSISLDELEEPDISKYATFNAFFYRKLKAGVRPVHNAEDPMGFCSAADCRLTVYPSVSAATQFWIKGSHFSVASLLGENPTSEKARLFMSGGVAIFRLAPQDYHRFHSPIDGVVGEITEIPGQYYTVNPQAVNEPGFDVFTDNKRQVLYMTHTQSGAPIAFVAIGAMLVGSIAWTEGGKPGATVKRGDELGYFAYGGSTVVALFPPGIIQFDEDLLENSTQPIETLVKVGDSLGKSLSADGAVFDREAVLRAADETLASSNAGSDGPIEALKVMAGKLRPGSGQ